MQRLRAVIDAIAARGPHRLMAGLAASAALFALIGQTAQAHGRPALATLKAVVTATAAPAPEPMMTLVFEGKDVDGDGAPDFVNPTGLEVRAHDDFGYGHFGASRDGGSREHEGVDYVGVAGQDIVSPISGQVTRMGYAYSDGAYKYVEITNPATGYEARVFYVNAQVAIGDHVALGQKIGVLKSLQPRYPGITDHVHLEITRRGARLDAGQVIVARWEREDTGA